MKPIYLTLFLAAAAAGPARLAAQSNKPPGPTEYNAFSGFIAGRNIFDPNRQPHYTSTSSSHHHTHTHTSVSTPSFIFVGALSYEKGLFAFFSGNEPELKQILSANQVIAGYTVTEISLDSVKLVSADKKEQLELKVGDVMRQDGTKWENTGAGEIPTAAAAAATESSGSGSGSGSGAAPAAPTLTPDSAPNDILKRLMEQRQKESQ